MSDPRPQTEAPAPSYRDEGKPIGKGSTMNKDNEWLAAYQREEERSTALRAERDVLAATVDAVRRLVEEHEATASPAPYTSERALIERLRGIIDLAEVSR